MPENVTGSPVNRAARAGIRYERPARSSDDSVDYGLIGSSGAIQSVRRRIGILGPSPAPVLILGETGTGKDLCAKALGRLSGRHPFVAVNCAAIAESLVESELFGHERGAFTGAIGPHDGLIAAANDGVLFLDELAELPFKIQAKLLRALQSGEYRRVGATSERKSSFRILAATSWDVDTDAGASRLYDALVHRVGAARIRMPALRDRVEDIPLLAASFLEGLPVPDGRRRPSLAPEACAALMQEEWPGNVRQLKNVVEVASVFAGGEDVIGIEHVAEALPSLQGRTAEALIRPLAEVRRIAEERAIAEALWITEGNRQRAIELLDISEATFYSRAGRTRRQAAIEGDLGSQV
jgi:DNA-binding NtrC family response regulator